MAKYKNNFEDNFDPNIQKNIGTNNVPISYIAKKMHKKPKNIRKMIVDGDLPIGYFYQENKDKRTVFIIPANRLYEVTGIIYERSN